MCCMISLIYERFRLGIAGLQIAEWHLDLVLELAVFMGVKSTKTTSYVPGPGRVFFTFAPT